MNKLFLFLIMCFLPCVFAQAQDVVLVVHQDSSIETISRADLRNIFFGKKTEWNNGEEVRPIMLKPGALHSAFLKFYLKRTNTQFNIYWKRMIFSGKGVPPKSFKTEDEMLAFIKENKGMIGYVSKGKVGTGVKTVKII